MDDYAQTPRKRIFNRKIQKAIRTNLRHNLTAPEQFLWSKIRNNQLGAKFRRQHGIGRYVVDFYCAEYRLVLELDGDSHYQKGAQEYDQIRDEFMRSLGLIVLRFSNKDIVENMECVLAVIVEQLQTPPPTLPFVRGGSQSSSPSWRGRLGGGQGASPENQNSASL